MELLLNVKEKGILPVICFFIFICVLVLSGCGRQEEENLQTEGQPSGGGGYFGDKSNRCDKRSCV